MAIKTEHLGLLLPEYTDPADIQVINGNMKILDNVIGDGSAVNTKIATHNNNPTAHADEFKGYIKKSELYIYRGEVANGGTIPLPDGFLESECTWFVGIKHSNVNEWRIDVAEGTRSNLLAPICTLNGRVVTVGTQVAGLDGGSYTENGTKNFGSDWARAFMPGVAWYLIICVKK